MLGSLPELTLRLSSKALSPAARSRSTVLLLVFFVGFAVEPSKGRSICPLVNDLKSTVFYRRRTASCFGISVTGLHAAFSGRELPANVNDRERVRIDNGRRSISLMLDVFDTHCYAEQNNISIILLYIIFAVSRL